MAAPPLEIAVHPLVLAVESMGIAPNHREALRDSEGGKVVSTRSAVSINRTRD